jgi:hypothetical protein
VRREECTVKMEYLPVDQGSSGHRCFVLVARSSLIGDVPRLFLILDHQKGVEGEGRKAVLFEILVDGDFEKRN